MGIIKILMCATALAVCVSVGGCGLVVMAVEESEKAQKQANREKADAELRANPPAVMPIYFDNSSGKVGHHTISTARAACSLDNTPWSADTVTHVSGSLPPGMALTREGNTRIEGTPDQPGNWSATVRFKGIACRGKTYPDQDVNVSFSITGDAVKGL